MQQTILVELDYNKNNNIIDYLAIYKKEIDQNLYKRINFLQKNRDRNI